jgi:CheY-like chemotaxis protein
MAETNGQAVSTTAGHRAPMVLVIEDEAAARVATRSYLQHCGYRVTAAGTAAEAIRVARELHPDVLVCDWKLEGRRNGVDVVRLLQREQDVDVIFVTASALNDLRQSAPDLHLAVYLRKPVSLGALASIIASMTTRRKRSLS